MVSLYVHLTGLEEQKLFQEERSTDGGMVDGTPSSTLQEMQRTESRKTGISSSRPHQLKICLFVMKSLLICLLL